MRKVISHSDRPLALAALLLLCGAKAPLAGPPTGHVPDWLLGTWVLIEVREDNGTVYPKKGGPKNWYHPGDAMTIMPDRLTFFWDACVVGSVEEKRGLVSVPVLGGAGVGLDAFDLPPERKPVDYIATRCAHSLLGHSDGRGVDYDRGIKLTWYVIRRSPTEIDMPFLGGSFLKFRKAAPTS